MQVKIGYYLNPKKLKKFDTQNVFDFPYRDDIKFVFLDFSDETKLNVNYFRIINEFPNDNM